MRKPNQLSPNILKAIAAVFFALVLFVQPLMATITVLDDRNIHVTLTEITEELQEKETSKDTSNLDAQQCSVLVFAYQFLQLKTQPQDVYKFSQRSFKCDVFNLPPEVLA